MKKILLLTLLVLGSFSVAMAAQQTINSGPGVYWGTEHTKINENFTELYNVTESDPIFSAWDKDYNDLTNVPAGNTQTVVCDGVTDETLTVQAAIDTGYSLIFESMCSVDNLAFNQSGATYRGVNGGGLIQHTSGARVAAVTVNDVTFDNMIFSGNEFDGSVGLVNVAAGVTGTRIFTSEFKDISGIGTEYHCALSFEGSGSGAVVDNCYFHDLKSYNSDQLSQTAYIAGIQAYITTTGKNTFVFSNNRFNNIYSDNIGGDISLSSADGIRASSDALRDINLVISGNVFDDVQKSAIKIQQLSGVKIDSSTVRSNRAEVAMDSAIRSISNMPGAHITNTSVIGNVSAGIHIDAHDVVVDGLSYYPQGWNTDFTLVDIGSLNFSNYDSENITIRNLSGNNIFRAVNISPMIGLGQSQFCKNLIVENVSISVQDSPTADLDGVFNIINTDGVKIQNVDIKNDNDVVDNCLLFTDSDNVTISNVKASAINTIVDFIDSDTVVTGNNVKISNCDFIRTVSASSLHTIFLPVSSGVDGFNLINTSFSIPTYADAINNNVMRCAAKNILINDVSVITRDEGGGVANSSIFILNDVENFVVSNVLYDMQDASLQLDTEILAINGTSTGGVVSNVRSNSKGISVQATVTNLQIENLLSDDTAQLNISSGADVNSIRYTATGIEAYVNGAWTSLL